MSVTVSSGKSIATFDGPNAAAWALLAEASWRHDKWHRSALKQQEYISRVRFRLTHTDMIYLQAKDRARRLNPAPRLPL